MSDGYAMMDCRPGPAATRSARTRRARIAAHTAVRFRPSWELRRQVERGCKR